MLSFLHMKTIYDFSEWLRDEMNKRNMNQAELMRRSGLSSGAISQLVNAKRGAGKEACIALAKALSLPQDVVLRAAGYKTETTSISEQDERINHRIKMLSDEKRRQVEYFLNYLESWPESEENAVLAPNKKAVSVPERTA